MDNNIFILHCNRDLMFDCYVYFIYVEHVGHYYKLL